MTRSKVLLSGSVIALSMSIAGFANAQDNCAMNGGAPMHCSGAFKVTESIELNAPVQFANSSVEVNANSNMQQMNSGGPQCHMMQNAGAGKPGKSPCNAHWYEMNNNGGGQIVHQFEGSQSSAYGTNNVQSNTIVTSEQYGSAQYSGTGYFYESGAPAVGMQYGNGFVQNEQTMVSGAQGMAPNYSFGNETGVQYVYGGQMTNPQATSYAGVGPVPAKVPQVPVNYYGGYAGVPANVPTGTPNYSGYAYGTPPQYGAMPQYGAPNSGYPSPSTPNYGNMTGYGRGMPVQNGAIAQSFFLGPMAYGVGFPTQTGYLGGGSAYYGGGSRFSGVVGRSPTPLIPPGGKPNAPPPPPPVD